MEEYLFTEKEGEREAFWTCPNYKQTLRQS